MTVNPEQTGVLIQKLEDLDNYLEWMDAVFTSIGELARAEAIVRARKNVQEAIGCVETIYG